MKNNGIASHVVNEAGDRAVLFTIGNYSVTTVRRFPRAANLADHAGRVEAQFVTSAQGPEYLHA